MSVLIPLHRASLYRFLKRIHGNHLTLISQSGADFRLLKGTGLMGNENRPFTSDELDYILYKYRYFEASFKREGLWPERRETYQLTGA